MKMAAGGASSSSAAAAAAASSAACSSFVDPEIKHSTFTSQNKQLRSHFTKLGRIGEGAYGVVYKAVSNEQRFVAASGAPPKYVAIKQMKTTREGVGIPQDAYREIKILKELHHEHIVKLERVFLNPSEHEVNLVYDYAEHDLADMIRVHRSKSTQCDTRVVKSVIRQVLSGLDFLHTNWIMHRDIKPANILVMGEQTPETGRVKIADFGLARIFQSPLRKLSDDGEVVTIWYRAPELLFGSKHYTRAIDIWAVGCIFAELLIANPLFPGEEANAKTGAKIQEDQIKKIFRVLGKPTPKQWPCLTDCPFWRIVDQWKAPDFKFCLAERVKLDPASNGFDLLTKMLHYDPAKRITAEEALKHPYFTEFPPHHPNVFRKADDQVLKYPTRAIRRDDAAAAAAAAAAAGATAAAATATVATANKGALPLAAVSGGDDMKQLWIPSGAAGLSQSQLSALIAAQQQQLLAANGALDLAATAGGGGLQLDFRAAAATATAPAATLPLPLPPAAGASAAAGVAVGVAPLPPTRRRIVSKKSVDPLSDAAPAGAVAPIASSGSGGGGLGEFVPPTALTNTAPLAYNSGYYASSQAPQPPPPVPGSAPPSKSNKRTQHMTIGQVGQATAAAAASAAATKKRRGAGAAASAAAAQAAAASAAPQLYAPQYFDPSSVPFDAAAAESSVLSADSYLRAPTATKKK